MKSPLFFTIGLFALLALASGCGGNQSLSGKITFEDDGSPLPVGVVIFTDGKNQSRGTIQPDGTYVVGTRTDKDGLPDGEYEVYIVNAVHSEFNETTAEEKTTPLIAEKYGRPETSGITYTTGSSTFNFQVERAR